jgi:hypothetical protein
MPPKVETEEHPIQYTPRPDPATYCPLLYAPCDSSSGDSSEEEPTGPREVRTSEIGCGDDLSNGVLAVDAVRFLSNKVRQEVKGIGYLDLSDGLLRFIDCRRAYLNRRLQYFVNMLLLPHVGYRREKVRIIFEGYWLDPREFTVNVKAKERRGYKKDSNFFLRSLKEVTQDISNILVEIMDFAKVVAGLRVKDDDYHLLLPLFTRVIDAVSSVEDEKAIEYQHRLHQLQKLLNESTEHLNEPDIMKSLSEEQEDKEFWKTVDLKSFVRWKIQKQSE